jgi:uncharacterized protein DUF4438
MSLVFPELTVTLQQRRWACVLDPSLILSPYGLALSRLGEVVELWVGRELWHMLDNTHFYTQRPSLLVDATTRTTDDAPESQEALQALLAWEGWRLENDQAALKLFWVGDDASGSLLPAHVDARLAWRYEMLAGALDRCASRTETPDQVLAPAIRDTVALAVALRTSLILARSPLAAPSASQSPLLCTALAHWGVPCVLLPDHDPFVRVERDYLRHLLVHAGLAPLLWAGLRLAVVHIWVPGVSALWPEPHQEHFDGMGDLPEATDAALPTDDCLWRAAQGFCSRSERDAEMSHYAARRHYYEPVAINQDELVLAAVLGQIAPPVAGVNPYRIGHDGIPRVLPGTGGIALNQRIGDRCVGLAGDHVEPGVALHNNSREVIGIREGPNLALLTYACVGNRARVVSGPCTGQWGLVTGKHGGVNHVLVDFPPAVLRRLCIGDRMQIYAVGLGLRLLTRT